VHFCGVIESLRAFFLCAMRVFTCFCVCSALTYVFFLIKLLRSSLTFIANMIVIQLTYLLFARVYMSCVCLLCVFMFVRAGVCVFLLTYLDADMTT
jgi:hypothetical protein